MIQLTIDQLKPIEPNLLHAHNRFEVRETFLLKGYNPNQGLCAKEKHNPTLTAEGRTLKDSTWTCAVPRFIGTHPKPTSPIASGSKGKFAYYTLQLVLILYPRSWRPIFLILMSMAPSCCVPFNCQQSLIPRERPWRAHGTFLQQARHPLLCFNPKQLP